MLKFFRSIRKTLLNEGKTSKYFKYAIGEIFLVVIGILIALQINNWNTRRQSDQKEQKILKILKSEFLYNKHELNRNIEKATTLMQNADSLLLYFDTSKERIDAGKLRRLTGSLGAYSTFDPSNGALTNLISSGELNLIKNDSLRITLSKWFGEVQDVKEDEVRLINYGDTYLEPLRLEFMNYKKDSYFDRNMMAILNNPRFENVVTRISRAANYNVENYQMLDLEIENILTLLDSEIEHKYD